MTVTGNIIKKVKIRIVSKKHEAAPKSEPCEIGEKLFINDEIGSNMSLNRNKKFVPHSPESPVQCATDHLKVKLTGRVSNKRGPLGMIDNQNEKRRKMDRSVKQQCVCVLRSLLDHRFGFPFKVPVNPVALGIPDYFSIITEPMDLGTIKKKVQEDKYFNVEEFAADVRLTFSNAMHYNPPSNDVHRMAKELANIFNRKWKALEAKWNQEIKNVKQGCISSSSIMETQQTRYTCSRNSLLQVSSCPDVAMSPEEKVKLRKELVEASKGRMSEELLVFLQKLGLILQKGGKVEIEMDAFDDETLWELKRVVKDTLDARAAKSKVYPAKLMVNDRHPSLGKVSHKGTTTVNRSTIGPVKSIPPRSTVSSQCACGSVRCQCSLKKEFAQVSSSDLFSERSLGSDRGASKMDHQIKNMLASNTSNSDPESDGAVSLLDEENVFFSPRLSALATTAASGYDWTPGIDVQLSPKRALRAAMLKSRFADTILKAKQKTLLDHGDKADHVKLQQEKESLERQQQEEKTRIEAQIRAAEAASRRRAEEELRMRREREREAARIALQKMEKTVEIDENLKFLKDLEMLLGASHIGNPLERLGLFIKEDYAGDEEDESVFNGDGEDGEILS